MASVTASYINDPVIQGAFRITVTGSGFDISLGAPAMVWTEPDGTVLNYRVGVFASGELDGNYLVVTQTGTYKVRVFQPAESKGRKAPKIDASSTVVIS